MDRLTPLELSNWTALYLATAMCCALAATMSIVVLGVQLSANRPWRETAGWRDVALLVPRTWWRWQKLYLLSTPVTLAIVTAFAWSMRWQ